MILIGCLYVFLLEVKEIVEFLRMCGKFFKIFFFIIVSRVVKVLVDVLGYIEIIECYNGKIIFDLCFVVLLIKGWYRGIVMNSGKLVFYFCFFGFSVWFDDVENLIKEVL